MDIEQLITSRLRTALRDAGLSSKATCEENQLRPALLSFLTSMEQVASEVCKTFNPFGLLCALQHYLPIHIMKPTAGFEPDAQLLFNNAAALAFRFSSSTEDAKVKFTRVDYERIAESSDYSWLEDYTEVVQQIHYMVNIIDLTINGLHCLGKGATANVNPAANNVPGMVSIQTPTELQQKVSQYDERLIRNQDILLWQGIPSGLVKPETPLKCIVVNPNWNEFRKGKSNPPPIPLVFGMDAIYSFTSLHSEDVIEIFYRRAHVEDLFVFIAALIKPLVEQSLDNVRFAGQGYGLVEEQHLVKYVMNWAPTIYSACFGQQVFPNGTAFVLESLDPSYWQEVAPKMLRFVAHDFTSRNSIDCLLFRPTRFVYICDDCTVFLHLGTVMHFFAHLLDQFSRTGQFGDIKGKVFEMLLTEVIESVNGFKRVWEPRRKIQFPVAGRVGTDVDVFVQRNELAFLIGCKSYGVNRDYELGDGQVCWSRSEEAKSWLRFVHQTAKVIAEHHEELRLPKEIRGILPFVCTGWPEYIFEPSDDYFIADGTPRIAALREMEQFCRSMNDDRAQELLLDPWVIPIPQE